MLASFQQLASFQDNLRRLKTDRRGYASPDYSKMRFRLGTSLAETKIPYVFSKPFAELLRHAADTLMVAVHMRHRNELGPMEVDAVLLEPAALNVNLRPESWYVGDIPANSVFFSIITRSVQQSKRLDAGLLLWWLGKDNPGRAVVNEINRYIQKLDKESIDRGNGEETLRLGLIALIRVWSEYASNLEQRMKHPMLKDAYNACAIVHYEILRALLEEHFRPTGVVDRQIGDPAAAAYQALTLPLSPLTMAAGKTEFGADAIGPFGLSNATIRTLEQLFPKMLDRATPVAEVAKQLLQKVTADRNAPKTVLNDVRRQRLQAAVVDLLMKIKPGDDKSPEAPVLAELHRIRKDPDAFLRQLEDKKQSKEWADQWKRITIEPLRPLMESFQQQAQAVTKLGEGFFSDKAALAQAYSQQVERFIILRHMEALNAALLEQKNFLREAEGGEAGSSADYEQGKLYRLAPDDQLVLKGGATPQEAQLFVDLKDFTKRTFSSKEMAMADFMKWEFYDPIIRAAKKYAVGMAHFDNSNLAINNLMGDAVLASGGVKSLLSFAHDILDIAEEYRGKLKEKMPAALVATKLQELDAAFEARQKALETERTRYLAPAQKLTAEMNALAPEDPKRKVLAAQIRGYQEAAGSAERRLKQHVADRADERATIEGTGLEAGIYVAFGNAAEIVGFKDELFGNLRVAIGEKINESARGTAREATVRQHLNYIVDSARAANKRPEMEYPFRVFVDNTIHPLLDPDLEGQLRAALGKKDPEAVKQVVTGFSQRLMNDLVNNAKREAPEYRTISMGNGIYNLGLAVSGDALDAYVKAVGDRRNVISRELVVAELHEEIQRAFVFSKERYPAVVVRGENADDEPEVFVELGGMVFKGFEKMDPQRIFECLSRKSLFYRFLAKHHLGQWVEAAVKT